MVRATRHTNQGHQPWAHDQERTRTMTRSTTTPCLWFTNEGEQAAEYYTGIFPNSRILEVSRYGPSGPGPEGSVMTVSFELDGAEFLALNGGQADFSFNEAV